jgi:hypothetical protein
MSDTIQGTFHFHSTYSHDGRNSLAEIAASLQRAGYSFCVMTEHFEDLDEPKFARYVQETKEASCDTRFIFIPGIEVHLAGVDTIMFPVQEYEPIRYLADGGSDTATSVFKVVAHPSKYPFDKIVRHLETFRIDAIELWNQQADSSYIPPFQFLELVHTTEWRNQYRYFFGCDLHSAKLAVANVIVMDKPGAISADAIVQCLKEGSFTARNLVTGIEYRNGSPRTDFSSWLKAIRARSYYRGRILRKIRSGLRSAYKKLPRYIQRRLNDVKNVVRNNV